MTTQKDHVCFLKSDRSKRFLYDGWNVIAELKATNNTLIRSYLWGVDLSGSLQGAGGVGGLLAVKGSGVCHFTAYDGNGNVIALIDGSTGTPSAQYEYGPFGEMIRATGTMAESNPFHFSTKYQDEESGFYYYGYRYYNSNTGRWLSRDPIAEEGGNNLYASFEGDPISKVDLYGLACRGIKFQTLSFGNRGRFGPLGWKAEARRYLNVKECDTCCGKKDDVVEIGINGQASLDGASYRASWVSGGYGVSFWGGIQARVGAGGNAQAVFKSDKCNGLGLNGSVCLSVRGFGSLGGGGVSTIQWGYTIWTVGAELVGTGAIEWTKCHSCKNGICEWGKTKVCLAGDLSSNAHLGLGSVSFGLWNDKTCFELQ